MSKCSRLMMLLAVVFGVAIYTGCAFAEVTRIPLAEPLTPPNPSIVKDGYVYIQDGHLYRNGQRLRLWGVNIVQEPARPIEEHGQILDRIQACGFNAIRLHLYDWIFVNEGDIGYRIATYEKGDDSLIDRFDHFIAEAVGRGFVLYMTFDRRYRPILPEAYDRLSSDDPEPLWQDAVADLMSGDSHAARNFEMVWPIDQRLETAFINYAQSLLAHRNQYTGRTYAEESAVALWEISNEANFVRRIFRGWLDDQHPYWRQKLQRRWNDFLRDHYKNDANLRRAWGRLESGESLEDGTIALAPLALPSSPPPLHEHQKYSSRRAEDIVTFVINRYIDANQKVVEVIRQSADEGEGAAVVPIIFDTHHNPDLMNLYAASAGTVTATGAYKWLRTYDQSDPLYPIAAMATQPPGFHGMDMATVSNKPTVVYEVNVQKPAYYRAEFPFMVGSFAAGQDWDAVFWYHWMPSHGASLQTRQDLSRSGMHYSLPSNPWAGVVIHTDEILLGALRVMGEAFIRGDVMSARQPLKVKVGLDALTRPDLQSYWKRIFGIASFHGGSRILFSPESRKTLTSRNALTDWPENGSALGPDIRYAYGRDQLVIDNAKFHVFAGWLDRQTRVRFSSGLTIEPDQPEEFLTFAVLSLDEKPIEDSERLLITLLGEGENTGFVYDPAATEETGYQGMIKSIVDTGDAPVVIRRPAATVEIPGSMTGVVRYYDALPSLLQEQDFTGVLRLDGSQPVTWIEIDRQP